MIYNSSNKTAGRFLLVLCLMFAGTFLLTMVASGVTVAAIGESRESVILSTALQNLLMFCLSAWMAAKITLPDSGAFLGITVPTNIKSIAGVVLIWLVSMPMLNEIIVWNESIHLPASMSNLETALRSMEEANAAVGDRIMNTSSIGGLLVNILTVGIITGFSEELFFRGALQRGFRAAGLNHHVAIWVAAIIFSAVHFQFFGFVPRVLMGAVFGYIFMWTGSIYPGAFAHALNNSAVVIATWLTQNGYTSFDFEHFGVSDNGIGLTWIISTLLFSLIIIRRRIFFTQSQTIQSLNGQDNKSVS